MIIKTKGWGHLSEHKAGWTPRAAFLRELRRVHPVIRIGWSRELQTWLCCQMSRFGEHHLVFECGRMFGERWLLNKLNKCRMAGRDPDEVAGEVDAQTAIMQAARATAARERIQEGADRHYSATHRSLRAVMPNTPELRAMRAAAQKRISRQERRAAARREERCGRAR